MVSTFSRVEYGSTRYGCQGKLNRKDVFALSQFAPENLASRTGFGRLVPRQPAYYSHSGSICYLFTGFLPLPATESIYPVNRHRVNPKLIRSRAIACRRRSLPRVLRRPQGSSSRGSTYLGNPIDSFMCAALFPQPLLIQCTHVIQRVS